jgi:hypothetical protein
MEDKVLPYMIALVVFPLVAAGLLYFVKSELGYKIIVRVGAAVVVGLTLAVVVMNYSRIYTANLHEVGWLKYGKMAAEVGLSLYIIYLGVRLRWYLLSVFSGVALLLTLGFEMFYGEAAASPVTV